jgi:PAB1-binding protein PBP1
MVELGTTKNEDKKFD